MTRTAPSTAQPPTVTGLRVELFGDMAIESAGQPVRLQSAKAQELLCYLLVHRDRAHSRDALAQVLWPDADPATSRKYLRQTFWKIGRSSTEFGPAIIGGQGWVRAVPGPSWWLDVDEFERACVESRNTHGPELSEAQAGRLASAARLYTGDLIASCGYDWCGYERDRLQLAYLTMLEQLMSYCEAGGQFGQGIGYGQDALRYDPAREGVHYRLMTLLYAAGQRTMAIRQFHSCAAAMAQELGVEPSAATIALHERIRRDDHGGGRPPLLMATPTVRAEALAGLHRRLDEIQASLTALQNVLVRPTSNNATVAETEPTAIRGRAMEAQP